MGDLEKKIANDLKECIKNKDTLKTSTLRMIIAAVKNLAIEKQVKEVQDSDVMKVISKQVKQHQDAIASFKKGGREDLVDKESRELKILQSYLPKQLSEKEVEAVVKKIISEIGATSKSEFGKVMKLSIQELTGKADGKLVSSIVQKLLK